MSRKMDGLPAAKVHVSSTDRSQVINRLNAIRPLDLFLNGGHQAIEPRSRQRGQQLSLTEKMMVGGTMRNLSSPSDGTQRYGVHPFFFDDGQSSFDQRLTEVSVVIMVSLIG
jgi:hypothetical protein